MDLSTHRAPGRARVLPFPLAAKRLHQFRVSIARADGQRIERVVSGGTSFQHTIDAIDEAGEHGLVRVIRVDSEQVAA